MAFTIPESLASRPRVTSGERKVFEALRDELPEDYLVYYDTVVRQRHPDFIVVGPGLGLVVLEVKKSTPSTAPTHRMIISFRIKRSETAQRPR